MTFEEVPVLTLGLPVFNGEEYIEELLESVMAQTFTDFEVVISNNASTDNTATICSKFANGDKRIRYFDQAENIGLFPNVEFVFNQGRGKYFTMIAHDDKYEPCYLEKLMAEHYRNPELDLVYSDYAYINGQDEVSHDNKSFFMQEEDTPYLNFKRYLRKKITLPVMFGVFKKSTFQSALPFVDFGNNMTGGVDLVFLYNVLASARVASIREKLFFYRIKDRSDISPKQWRSNRFLGWFRVFTLNFRILICHQFPIISSSDFSLKQKLEL